MRKSKTMKCLLIHLSLFSPPNLPNFNYRDQILKAHFLPSCPPVSYALNPHHRAQLRLLCSTPWTDWWLFFWLWIQGSWSSSSRINPREYCSSSITGVKAMASAKIVNNPESISYLNQREAAEIDEILMGPLGFSVDQLMVSFFNLFIFYLCFSVRIVVLLCFQVWKFLNAGIGWFECGHFNNRGKFSPHFHVLSCCFYLTYLTNL